MGTIVVKKNSDPFKKYWWLILILGLGIGGWVLYPSFNSGNGQVLIMESALKPENQNLNSLDQEAGQAPGSPVHGLSMPGSGPYAKKKWSDPFVSFLYQSLSSDSPSSNAAPQAATPAESLSKIASSLTSSELHFSAPTPGVKASFSALPDVTNGEGNSSAFSSNQFKPFGEHEIHAQMVQTPSAAGAPAATPSGSSSLDSLKSAAVTSVGAAGAKFSESAAMNGGMNFDGVKNGGGGVAAAAGSSSGRQGGAGVGIGGSVADNLKVNDPKLMAPGSTAPPVIAPTPANSGNNFMQMLISLVVSVLIGGVLGPAAKAIF